MSGESYNILIVDDEADVIESTSVYLMRLAEKFKDHINLFYASSGIDALSIYDKNRIDAIFIDYLFEYGMNGDEIIDQIIDPFGYTLFILMSARDKKIIENVLIKQRKRLGSRLKFLRKPFDELEIQDKYLEIVDFFESLPYPFPLAVVFDTFQASSIAQAKLTALKDLIEVSMKYIVSILLSDMHRLDLIAKTKSKINIKSNLTYGAWMNWLQELLSELKEHEDDLFVPEIIRLFGNKHNYLEMINSFKYEVRDAELGHGYLKEEEWYKARVDDYSKIINQFYDDCLFLSRYILFEREHMDFAEDGSNGFEYSIRSLMGAEVRPNTISFSSKYRLKKGNVYLYNPNCEILPLYPMIEYMNCKECSLNHLYILDQIQSNQIVYNSFCNHRQADRKSFNYFWDVFRGMFG